MWMEELIEESKIMSCSIPRKPIYTALFSIILWTSNRKSCWSPISDEKRTLEWNPVILNFFFKSWMWRFCQHGSGENMEIRDDDSDDTAELSAPLLVSLWSPLHPCTHFYSISIFLGYCSELNFWLLVLTNEKQEAAEKELPFSANPTNHS